MVNVPLHVPFNGVLMWKLWLCQWKFDVLHCWEFSAKETKQQPTDRPTDQCKWNENRRNMNGALRDFARKPIEQWNKWNWMWNTSLPKLMRACAFQKKKISTKFDIFWPIGVFFSVRLLLALFCSLQKTFLNRFFIFFLLRDWDA